MNVHFFVLTTKHFKYVVLFSFTKICVYIWRIRSYIAEVMIVFQTEVPSADQFYHVLESQSDNINPRTSTMQDNPQSDRGNHAPTQNYPTYSTPQDEDQVYSEAIHALEMQGQSQDLYTGKYNKLHADTSDTKIDRGPSPNIYSHLDQSGQQLAPSGLASMEESGELEYSVQDIQLSTDMLTLEEWLEALGLECYHDTMVENGWVNLMVLREMTEFDLDIMDIQRVSDRKKIMTAIECLHNSDKQDKTVVI